MVIPSNVTRANTLRGLLKTFELKKNQNCYTKYIKGSNEIIKNLKMDFRMP